MAKDIYKQQIMTMEQSERLFELEKQIEVDMDQQKDPVQRLMFDVITCKITEVGQIQQRIADIDLEDKAKRDLRYNVIFAQSLFGLDKNITVIPD